MRVRFSRYVFSSIFQFVLFKNSNYFTFIYKIFRGLAIHAFHGSFFVRSTDLLSLPNVSPDAGFGMQLAIEESLSDVQHVCFQAALLYTSSKGKF